MKFFYSEPFEQDLTLKEVKWLFFIFMPIVIGIWYNVANPGNAIFDTNDNIPWRSDQRKFCIKLVPSNEGREEELGIYHVAFSNNGFLTSQYLNYLNDVGRTPFEDRQFVFDSDNKRLAWVKSLTFSDCVRINKSITAYLDEVEKSKHLPVIKICP